MDERDMLGMNSINTWMYWCTFLTVRLIQSTV